MEHFILANIIMHVGTKTCEKGKDSSSQRKSSLLAKKRERERERKSKRYICYENIKKSVNHCLECFY